MVLLEKKKSYAGKNFGTYKSTFEDLSYWIQAESIKELDLYGIIKFFEKYFSTL